MQDSVRHEFLFFLLQLFFPQDINISNLVTSKQRKTWSCVSLPSPYHDLQFAPTPGFFHIFCKKSIKWYCWGDRGDWFMWAIAMQAHFYE